MENSASYMQFCDTNICKKRKINFITQNNDCKRFKIHQSQINDLATNNVLANYPNDTNQSIRTQNGK